MNPYKRMYVLPEEEYNRLKLATITHRQTEAVPEVVTTQPQNESIPIVADEQPKVEQVHQTFKCQVCGKVYSNKGDRRRHIQKAYPHPTIVPPIVS